MRILVALTLVVLMSVLQAETASAQLLDLDLQLLAEADRLAERVKEEARQDKRQLQRDPLVRSKLTLPEPQLSFETQKGKGRATGTIGFVKSGAGGERSVLLAFSSPIGEAEDAVATALDLRGLSDGATVGLAVSGSSMFRRFSASDVRRACVEANVQKELCTAGKLEQQSSMLSEKLLDIVFRRVPVVYAAGVSFGRNKYIYFDAVGAKQDAVRRNDVEVEGTLGFLVNARTNLLAFHVTYADAYKASADKTQLCRPLTDSMVSRCDAAIIGEPKNGRSAVGTVEYRIQIARDSKVPIALAPKVQYEKGYDGGEDIKAFEVPIYFFQEKADPEATSSAPKLNGGVSSGWRSDSGFQVSVFIGTTFKLFKI